MKDFSLNVEPRKKSNGSGFPKGVYIDKIKITNMMNKKSEWNDINLYIEGEDVSGKSLYPKKFFLGGKHAKDGDKFVGWGDTKNGVSGGSWKVRDFLLAVGIEKDKHTNMVLEDGSLSEEVIGDCLGRTVYILQYESNGKYSRETWFYFESGESTDSVKNLLDKWNGFDDKPNKYLHSNKTEVQNKKLNAMWDNLPDNNKTNKELDGLGI